MHIDNNLKLALEDPITKSVRKTNVIKTLQNTSGPKSQSKKDFRFVKKPTKEIQPTDYTEYPGNFCSEEYMQRLPWDIVALNTSYNDFYTTSKIKHLSEKTFRQAAQRISQQIRFKQLLSQSINKKSGGDPEKASKLVSLGMVGFVKDKLAEIEHEQAEKELVSSSDP